MSVVRMFFANVQRWAERRIPVRLPEPRPRIVASFTTTPHRIENVNVVIESLLQQTLPPDSIIVSIPHLFRRDNLEYVIPDWLAAMPSVLIHRTADRGPATKLLGALEIEQDPDTIIITVDDDNRYPEFVIRHLVARAFRDPRSVHTVSGGHLDVDENGEVRDGSSWGVVLERRAGKRVFMLEGHGGVAYRRGFFDNEVFDFPSVCRECYLGDDLTLSFYLALRNIPVRIARDRLMRKPWTWALEYGNRPDALHFNEEAQHSRNADNYRVCFRELRRRYPDVSINV